MSSPIDRVRAAHVLRIAAGLGVGVIALACVACNTTEGVGRDVEAAGEGLQEIADDTKDAIKD